MAVTVRGTDILFNDGTTQSTAAVNGAGINHTWQSVSRSVGTAYQNTTGRPIVVSVNAASSDNAGLMQVSADGSSWLTLGDFFNYTSYQVTVPHLYYYRVSGTVTQLTWTELR